MPKIPMLKNAAVQMARENLPTYAPQKLESMAPALDAFAGAMDDAANTLSSLLDGYTESQNAAKDNAALRQLDLNDHKAAAEMDLYAKEHPEDYANFDAKFKEISDRYAKSNEDALSSMSWGGRRRAQGLVETRNERRAFDAKVLARRSMVEWNIKDIGAKSEEACDLGDYEAARNYYRAAGVSKNGEAPLLSPEQVKTGIDFINSREQFDQFSGFIENDGFMEVFE